MKTKYLGNNFLNFHVSNPISIWKRQKNEDRFQRHYLFISSFPKSSLIIPQLTHVWLLAQLILVFNWACAIETVILYKTFFFVGMWQIWCLTIRDEHIFIVFYWKDICHFSSREYFETQLNITVIFCRIIQ